MIQLLNVLGTVISFANGIYTLKVGAQTAKIPWGVMHRCVDFPNQMLEDGHVKVGEKMALTQKGEATYYPDHAHYMPKKEKTPASGASTTFSSKTAVSDDLFVDGNYLLKGLQPYSVAMDYSAFMTDLSVILPSLESEKREQILLELASSHSDDFKMTAISAIAGLPVCPVESSRIEKKEHLFAQTSKKQLEKNRHAQLKDICETVISFCNSKEQRPCKVIVGLSGQDNTPTGLQKEIAAKYPGLSLAKFQSTVLVPYFLSCTCNNTLFVSSIDFQWYNLGGNLILVIEINYTGNPIVTKGSVLPYRHGSSKRVSEGTEMVSFIVDFAQNNL